MANPEDLGRYRLRRLLGRGVLGEVWEAADVVQEGARVCVKIMHAADEELAFARVEFAREARLAAVVRHPNLVTVQDSGEAAGTSFLVMDMVEGTSLQKILPEAKARPLAEKLRWLREIGGALSALHHAGLFHKDVKPENVIVRSDGSACLVDLGIAKWWKTEPSDDIEAPPPSSKDEGSIYAPPEAASASVYDELGDQYAWGVLARELLAGDDAIPESVVTAIARASSTKREDRWDTMDLALEAIVVAPRARVHTTPLPPPSQAPAATKRPLVAVIAVGVVLLLIVAAVFLR
jgi:eukaryotic-like serine/threonine-protein kinase